MFSRDFWFWASIKKFLSSTFGWKFLADGDYVLTSLCWLCLRLQRIGWWFRPYIPRGRCAHQGRRKSAGRIISCLRNLRLRRHKYKCSQQRKVSHILVTFWLFWQHYCSTVAYPQTLLRTSSDNTVSVETQFFWRSRATFGGAKIRFGWNPSHNCHKAHCNTWKEKIYIFVEYFCVLLR